MSFFLIRDAIADDCEDIMALINVSIKGSFILERFLSESESDNIFASVLYVYIRAISERKRFPIWFVYMS